MRVTVPPKPERPPSASKAWLRAIELTAKLAADEAMTLGDVVDSLDERFGDAPAMLGDQEEFSFADLAARARRYCRWALAQGVGRGDVVALLMPNRPDYFAAWVGVSRTGAVVSLLNTNLIGRSLAHALNVSKAGWVIVDPRLEAALDAAAAYVDRTPRIARAVDAGQGAEPSDIALSAYSAAPLGAGEAGLVTQSDTALYIFTSGTTGLPKAARISHRRVLSWSGWFAGLIDSGPSDRLYNCLPMYHSVGGIAAIGAALLGGGSVVVREKFSATRFWSEIRAWDCTLFQYIGELCRYLLAAPPHPDEADHRLRLICGNGLRAEVWTGFQARFHVPRVLEFYAATEGSFSLYNVEGKVGAIGRAPPFLTHRFPAALVRLDPHTEAPMRTAAGRCIACAVDEPGEAISRISAADRAGASSFEGYTDDAASEQKRLHDVFEPGDLWFRTGDLMRKDSAGFFYFVDRIGDSFRWKGENVSSADVADVVAACAGVREAAVYGVALPGAEGRAGMAALSIEAGFDIEALRRRLVEQLPSFARPVLVRIVDRLPATETFKLKRRQLVDEGYDPVRVTDPLFVLDPEAGVYVRLDPAMFERLGRGDLRL